MDRVTELQTVPEWFVSRQSPLMARRTRVAIALLEGLSNPEIATARQTSVRTVANQVASLFRKLGVRSRPEAVAALGRLQRS